MDLAEHGLDRTGEERRTVAGGGDDRHHRVVHGCNQVEPCHRGPHLLVERGHLDLGVDPDEVTDTLRQRGPEAVDGGAIRQFVDTKDGAQALDRTGSEA